MIPVFGTSPTLTGDQILARIESAGRGFVPSGGTVDQVLAKVDGDDFHTYWRSLTVGKVSDTIAAGDDPSLAQYRVRPAAETPYNIAKNALYRIRMPSSINPPYPIDYMAVFWTGAPTSTDVSVIFETGGSHEQLGSFVQTRADESMWIVVPAGATLEGLNAAATIEPTTDYTGGTADIVFDGGVMREFLGLSDRLTEATEFGLDLLAADDAEAARTLLDIAELDVGVTWTTRTSPSAVVVWYGVCHGNGLFVAVGGSGSVATSPDGINWTMRTAAASNTWRSVCYGNGLFVAVSTSGSGNRVMTSPDGITWTARTSAADNNWYSVCYGNGLFVAVSNSGSGNRVMTSPDGITWTARTSAADINWYGVCHGNSRFVAVGSSGNTSCVMTSSDGILWTIQTGTAYNVWRSVCYGNGLFVAVSSTGAADRVMTSPDGVTWTARTTVNGDWRGVCYGGGQFVAVATTDAAFPIMTSPEGITWTTRTAPVSGNWSSCCYGDGLFLAAATGASWITTGKVQSSGSNNSDGVTNGPTVFTGPLTLRAASGSIRQPWYNESAGVDEKRWEWWFDGINFKLRAVNDAETFDQTALDLTRSGTTPTLDVKCRMRKTPVADLSTYETYDPVNELAGPLFSYDFFTFTGTFGGGDWLGSLLLQWNDDTAEAIVDPSYSYSWRFNGGTSHWTSSGFEFACPIYTKGEWVTVESYSTSQTLPGNNPHARYTGTGGHVFTVLGHYSTSGSPFGTQSYGLRKTIKNRGTGNLIVRPGSGVTFDGSSADITLAPGEAIVLQAVSATDYDVC
jgi:predicted RecA/RadA family phage recombinase